MLKSIVLSVLGFAAAAALADDVAQLVHGGTVTGYATVSDAFGAAADGDTVKLLADFAPAGNMFSTSKNVTFDLNGFKMSNAAWGDLLTFKGTHLLICNGTIESKASCVIAGSACQIEIEDCTLAGNTAFYSGNGSAKVRVGTGCRITTHVVLANSAATGFAVTIEDAVVTSDELLNKTGSVPVLLLSGGVYKTDPSNFVAPGYKAVTTTESGCNWAVVAAAPEELKAERVRTDGMVESYLSVQAAVSAATAGDTVRLLDDYVNDAASGFSINKRLIFDLNGHAIKNTISCNLVRPTVDGCVFLNGTIAVGGQCCFQLSGAGNTAYVSNCTLTASAPGVSTCSCYGGASTLFLGEGTKVLNRSFKSGNGSMKVIADGVVSTSALWIDSGTNNDIEIRSGRFALSPASYLAPETLCAAQVETLDVGTVNYVAFPESEPPQGIDLSDYVVAVDGLLLTTFDMRGVRADGEVRLMKDLTIPGEQALISDNYKPFTLNLAGHRLENEKNNFLNVYQRVNIVGDGVINAPGAFSVCLTGNASPIFVEDCTFEGNCFIWGKPTVYLLSPDSIVETTSFVSGDSGNLATVVVSNGVIRSTKLWDGGAGATGGAIVAAGGSWAVNPYDYREKAKMTFPEDRFVRCNPTTDYYDVIPFPSEVTYDLDDADFVAPTYVGAMPAGGKTVTVNLASDGQWNGRRKQLGDFSAMTNFEGFTFVLGTVPPELAKKDVALRYVNGKLSASVPCGAVIFVR